MLLTYVLIAFSACSFQSTVQVHSHRLPSAHTSSRLENQIDSLLQDSLLNPAMIGLQIISLEDSVVLYDRNSAKLFHPASNTKLLTTSTGLHALGTAFQFKTIISTDGTIAKGTLRGNLYVKAYGDPLFRTSDLDSLAEQLSAKELRTITGKLVGDRSYFDTLSWGKGWMWDDEPDADEAFISPMTVNANAVELEIRAGDRPGTAAFVVANPPTSFVEIRNSTVTSYDTLIPPLTVGRRHGENIVRVDGRIAPGSPNRKFLISVCRPEEYYLHLLRERFALRGITIQGVSQIDSTHGDIFLGGVYHSLDSVIHQINKPSDNIAAENLLKIIAAEQSGLPGTAERGLFCVKEYLCALGIDTVNMTLADGSGVSWYNMISPGMMVQLLRQQYESRETFAHLYESLPIAGLDGTLKSRMVGTRAEGNVRGKTGSLTGESCISGYVTSADGRLLAFSIFINHYPGAISYLRLIQDRILDLLANYKTTHQ